tara:strand:- start:198 stop:455 length:258 start_codon:yes stop_codon:yes gene_type:complete
MSFDLTFTRPKNTNKPANTENLAMYADPRKIKKNEVKVRFDDDVNELLDALVKNTGGQKAVLVRDIFMRGLKASVSESENKLTAA